MLPMLGLTASPAVAAGTSKGTDFWVAFEHNSSDQPTLSLFIAGSTATTGTVAVPGIGFSAPFTVTPGAVTTVVVPTSAEISTSDTVEKKGVHVTAGAEVSVYGLNRIQATTDAFLGLPTDLLGTEYLVLGYKNTNIVNATEFGVVATQNATTVTITPTVTTGAHPAGVAYNVAMNQGETYQLINTSSAPADLSGSVVMSDKPVAVFGGHGCANIPNGGTLYCDHVNEEMTPAVTWGKSFLTMPLATRTGGDTFRFLASNNATTVKVNGAVVATLNRGQLFEQLITGPSRVDSDKPILVAQYSNGTTFDNVVSDPFEMLIPPFEQFLGDYTVTTPASGFSKNFINIVVPNAAVGVVTLDGVPVPAPSYVAIPGSTFSGAQLTVALGSHNLSGPLAFGTFVYGFDSADSYGYPGGLSLAPVASVTKVVIAPKTATNPVGTQHCVTATVTDQNGRPLTGIRVDFAVTGVNPTAGFANTNATGVAQFCYTGPNAGTDTIVASVGNLSDTATKTWVPAGKADPSISTTPSGSVPVGGNVSDSATLSGGTAPTGTIAFTLYGPGDTTCRTAIATRTTAVAGNGTYGSGNVAATVVGTYNWTAVYSGDANDNSATSPCGRESVVVTKANPSIATTPSRSVPAGGNVSDSAKVSGGYLPTGSVVFTLYGAGDSTCKTPIASRTGTLSAGNASSGNVAVGPAGTYNWTAVYSGDANNNSVTSPCGRETVVVTPQRLTGRAYGLTADASVLGGAVRINVAPLPDTGFVSKTSSSTTSAPCVATLSGLVSANVLCANVTTVGYPGKSTASASAADAKVAVPSIAAITMRVVKSTSTTTCAGSGGTTTIDYLAVGGVVVINQTTVVAPNSTINVGVVKLVLNEQTPFSTPDKGLTVNAVHATVNTLGLAKVNVIVASSESDIGNCP